MIDPWLKAFSVISLLSGCIAIYFFLRIHREMERGSPAWILLAVTAVFLTATSLIELVSYGDLEFTMLQFTYWGAVYTAFFAGAGYVLYRAFVRIPAESLGRFLAEGFKFEKPVQTGKKPDKAGSRLVLYTLAERYEDAVIQLALECLAGQKNVLLITSGQKAEMYSVQLGGRVRVINIEDKPELAANELQGSAVVFDALSQFVLNTGFESAFKFLSKLIERVEITAFLNRQKHSGREIELLEDLFLEQLEVKGEKILTSKGKSRRAIQLKNYIDYEAYRLRG